MAEDLNSLLEHLRAGANEPGRLPHGWYSPSGDCVYFYNEDVEHREARVDHLLTIYRALSNDRIVGVKVKGIRSLPKHDLIGVRVWQDREIEFVELLLGTFYRSPDEVGPERLSVYDELSRRFRGRVRFEQLEHSTNE